MVPENSGGVGAILVLAECVFIDNPRVTSVIEQWGRDPRLQNACLMTFKHLPDAAYLQDQPTAEVDAANFLCTIRKAKFKWKDCRKERNTANEGEQLGKEAHWSGNENANEWRWGNLGHIRISFYSVGYTPGAFRQQGWNALGADWSSFKPSSARHIRISC